MYYIDGINDYYSLMNTQNSRQINARDTFNVITYKTVLSQKF